MKRKSIKQRAKEYDDVPFNCRTIFESDKDFVSRIELGMIDGVIRTLEKIKDIGDFNVINEIDTKKKIERFIVEVKIK